MVTPRRESRSPLKGRFQLHAEAVSNAIHEGEVARDGADIVDGLVIEARRPQAPDRFGGDAARSLGELHRVIEHGPVSLGQRDRPVIGDEGVHDGRRGRGGLARALEELTETRSVVGDSVMAAIGGRDHHGEHLALRAGEWPRPMH